ncbi:MAG: enoyl-CoA hydratase/isomerase family protein [Phycisphaerales bacterium]
MSGSPLVRLEQYDRLAVVVLSRPEKRNALTPAMFEELWRVIPAEDQIDGLVLAGDGPVFCGGFDLALCHREPETTATLLRALSETIDRLSRRDHPVVIAAKGAAIAGGAALLGAADIVIGDAAGTYGYPVVRIGLSPAVSFPYLRTLVSDGVCRERLLDSGLISGAEARRVGLIHECCDTPEDVGPRALRLCKALASKPRLAFSATKRLLRDLGGAEHTARAALDASLSTADSAECRERLARMMTPRPGENPSRKDG